MSDVNDSADLQALFDSVASQSAAASSAAAAPSDPPSDAAPASTEDSRGLGDSDDLQALFDSIAASGKKLREGAASFPPGEWEGQEKAFNTIGQLVRQLHDALLGLGYDKILGKTVTALPDTKDRLAYIANLTEQAACRVLNATDIALPLQEGLEGKAAELSDKWERLYANQLSVAEFKALADETRMFLKVGVSEGTSQTSAQLMEIMMAQDFQDLTGQVITKIVALTQEIQSSMTSLLIEIMPEIRRTEEVTSLLNGPVINSEGRTDVAVGQGQVDDLLSSLGF